MQLYWKMYVVLALPLLVTDIVLGYPRPAQAESGWLKDLIQTELNLLASIPDRRTGSPLHNQLINHIQADLKRLGLKVYSDTWYFDYNESPTSPPELKVRGKAVRVASPVAYSGNTGSNGITGELVNLVSPSPAVDWAKAKGKIAVLNITNAPSDYQTTIPLWPGSPDWPSSYVGVPGSVANVRVVNLTDAVDAGVKGIVYVWENVSSRLARGEYGPFWAPYQGIPAVYTAPQATARVLDAATSGAEASLTLTGKLISNHPTRNIWVIIPGTEQPEESIIISTHTDGVNIGEENGHIALLAYARSLITTPPKRTTILAFITGHIHSAPFSYATHRSTTLWLAQHTSYWNGSSPDQLTAVFGSCVEHLGLRAFVEDLEANTYKLTDQPFDEALFAATKELADLTFDEWVGVTPNTTRIINPLANGVPAQGGEGLPYLLNRIPEISLVTAPGWLLKQFTHGTAAKKGIDETTLIDFAAAQRQVASFFRIWRRVDGLSKEDIGTLNITAPGSKSMIL